MNNDLISREALKEEMQKADIKANDYETLAKMYENCVDNAPTVAYPFEKFRTMFCGTCQAYMRIEPQRPQGEWVPDAGGYQCNKCFDHALEINGIEIRSNFCPNCGADMRGKDDE